MVGENGLQLQLAVNDFRNDPVRVGQRPLAVDKDALLFFPIIIIEPTLKPNSFREQVFVQSCPRRFVDNNFHNCPPKIYRNIIKNNAKGTSL
jgi:hypothetical protein